MNVETKLAELAERLDMNVEELRADYQKYLAEGKNELNAIIQLRRQYKRMMERKNGWLLLYPFSRSPVREVQVERKDEDGVKKKVTDLVADVTGAFLFKDNTDGPLIVTTLSAWGEASDEVEKIDNLEKVYMFKGSYDDFQNKIYLGRGQHFTAVDDKTMKAIPQFADVVRTMVAGLLPLSKVKEHVNQTVATRAIVANVVKNKSKASGKDFQMLEVADEDSDIINVFIPDDFDADPSVLQDQEIIIIGRPSEQDGKVTIRAISVFQMPA
jgi:hypothetical protein